MVLAGSFLMMIGTERLSFLVGLLPIFSGEMFVQVIFPLINRIIFNIFDVELFEFTAYSNNESLIIQIIVYLLLLQIPSSLFHVVYHYASFAVHKHFGFSQSQLSVLFLCLCFWDILKRKKNLCPECYQESISPRHFFSSYLM